MKTEKLKEILGRFPELRIVVVGDVMLDRFIWGRVSRISPEAPVPVVEVTEQSEFPGGAANVVRNLRELGAKVDILSAVGNDPAGETLRRLLERIGVNIAGILEHPARRTTVKTRIIAHHQQVVRFDEERPDSISAFQHDELLKHLRSAIPTANAIIFEDYAKGVLSQELLGKMLAIAHANKKVTAADPNPRRLLEYHGLTAVTPNRIEAFAAAGIPYAEPAEEVLADQPLLRVGEILLKKWSPSNLLVTLGEHGMCLFRPKEKPHHIPTVAQEVFDVSGAGDTVIASLTLALAAEADPLEAAEISNHAAGVVVGKVGTATCSPDELMQSFARNRD
ncbi:MAG TPA: D-glycero-beta-D-manno-heptose-7-phosphate kinase [Verrucomicrobiae bacterium]|nr:D-glycero-beta-D-manno-heptose-7-phosphate kinase [Verrucomicrobiae bacterium]